MVLLKTEPTPRVNSIADHTILEPVAAQCIAIIHSIQHSSMENNTVDVAMNTGTINALF